MTMLATISNDLADSKNVMVASARATREYMGVMRQTAEVHTLAPGTGDDWKETTFGKFNAQNVDETTFLRNPQRFSDTALTLEPTLVGVMQAVTMRTTRKISPLSAAQMGRLSQNAMTRKADEDGLLILDGFTSVGAGGALTTSLLRAQTVIVQSNTTEPAPESEPVFIVLHGFQIAYIEDELTAGTGNENVTVGLSAEVLQNNFRGRLGGAQLLKDDNITIDGNSDAKGGVYSRFGMLHIEGTSPYVLTEEIPGLGGGTIAMYFYNEYVWGERTSEGTSAFGREVFTDAATPS